MGSRKWGQRDNDYLVLQADVECSTDPRNIREWMTCDVLRSEVKKSSTIQTDHSERDLSS